ncbi:MAG: Rab family GTPase [Candidatus Thorarchaeota archaeon]
MHDAIFKLCIFGDGGVGKTTLVNKYLSGVFEGNLGITIGLDFHVKTVEVNGFKVKLQIWDFAGEERFRFLLPSYLRGASGGIFMYDITRYSSLKNLNEWLTALNEGAPAEEKQIPILLVGGKTDLDHRRAVKSNEGFEMTKKNKLCGFFECSAKTGENVDKIFKEITRIMLEKAELFNYIEL